MPLTQEQLDELSAAMQLLATSGDGVRMAALSVDNVLSQLAGEPSPPPEPEPEPEPEPFGSILLGNQLLDGRSVSGQVRIEWVPAGGTPDVERVEWAIDAPDFESDPRIEMFAPYTLGPSPAEVWDSTTVENGAHTVFARVTAGGEARVQSATFAVNNEDSEPAPDPDPLPEPQPKDLTDVGDLTLDSPDQLAERLHVHGTLRLRAAGARVRDCLVEHGTHRVGIDVQGSRGFSLETVEVRSLAPGRDLDNPDANLNVRVNGSPDGVITHIRCVRGASGIYFVNSPGSVVDTYEMHDPRGGFPRGQVIQWDKSGDFVLRNFSGEADQDVAWTEDLVNVYDVRSSGGLIENGYLSGCNSPSGWGIIAEDARGIVVRQVDSVGNPSNFIGSGSGEIDFEDCRIWGIGGACIGLAGRPRHTSNCLQIGAQHSATARFRRLLYWNTPPNFSWEASAATLVVEDAVEGQFTPKSPLRLAFPWE